MRTYTKSDNTSEIHFKVAPSLLKRLKQEALDKETSLGKLLRQIVEDYFTK